MADLIKLDMTQIWATNGDKVQPSDAKIAEGWVVESVPRQTWNWFENRQDQNIAYLLQKGIPEWDSTTEYQINKSYVQRNGVVYKCIQTGINQDPALAGTLFWVKAFPEWTVALEYLRALTPGANLLPYFDTATSAKTTSLTAFGRSLIDDANAATARTTLSAQELNANLTGLASVAAANNVLPYFTGAGTMLGTTFTGLARTLVAGADAATMRATLGLGNTATLNIGTTAGTVAAGDDSRIVNALQKGNNLSDVVNAVLARANLGLGNAATQTITSTSSDGTTGRLLKTGDFGIGQQGVLVGDIDALTNTSGNGIYRLGTPYTGAPIANSSFTVIHTSYDSERTQIAILEGGVTVRQFIRKYSGSSWGAWVEVYHSGNTQAIANQVTANVQPTLDAKVNKSGDTMTGQLQMPSLNVIGTGTDRGYITMKAANSTNAYDVVIEATPAAASGTNGAGALRIGATAGTYFTTGGISVTGASTFNSNLGVVGNLTVTGAVNFTNTGNAAFAGPITAQGTGIVTTVLGIKAAAGDAGNTHLWFYNANGSAERALIYVEPSGLMHIRSVGQADTLTLNANRTASFGSNLSVNGNFSTNNATFSAVQVGGRVTCNDIVAAGAVYGNNGNVFMATDGNIYGSVWGGYLSSWIGNNVVTLDAFRGRSSDYLSSDVVGSVAFMQNVSGVDVGQNQQIAGGNLRFSSHNKPSGTAGSGTWRCQGYCNNGACAVFMRIA